jgi:hypothetical protein
MLSLSSRRSDCMRFVAYFMLETLTANARAGGTVTVVAGLEKSVPVYVRSGWTTVNYTATSFVAARKLGLAEADYVDAEINVLNLAGQKIYVQPLPQYQSPGVHSLGYQIYGTGSFTFYNAADQYLAFSEYVSGFVPTSLGDQFAGAPFYVYAATGETTVSGGDPPPEPMPSPPPAFSGPTPPSAPLPVVQSPPLSPSPTPIPSHKIYALIVSGQNDPTKVLPSQNTTLI